VRKPIANEIIFRFLQEFREGRRENIGEWQVGLPSLAGGAMVNECAESGGQYRRDREYTADNEAERQEISCSLGC